MINPAIIIIPIAVSLIVAIVLYFTCFTTRTIVPPAGWKPYTIRERRRISNWWRNRTKNDAGANTTRDLERNVPEESSRMLDRIDSVPLQNIETHRRADSFPSVESNGGYDHEGIDIGAEGEISSTEDDNERTFYESIQSTQPDLAPTISDVRLTIDAAENALQRIQDLRTQDLTKPSPSSPAHPPVLLSDEIDQINQLRTLKIWHDKMLASVWQHSEPTPPPIDLRYLKPFKKLVASCLTIASSAEEKLKHQLRSQEVMRTQDLSRYNDLRRTEEFARNSLRSLLRKKEQQQQQQSSTISSAEPSDEMETEVRQLGFRAMRERITLAKKLGLPVTDEGDDGEWGIDATGTIRIVGDVVGTTMDDALPSSSGRGMEARRTIQLALAAGQVEMSI